MFFLLRTLLWSPSLHLINHTVKILNIITIELLSIFDILIYSCNGKVEFSAVTTPVFSVT